ncbi:hypothetical protein SAMN05192552_102418 [Natrinema hispanicum]|uniref:Uncharacterized protein n=1 Tax=Natrinema hispanicum TaxID=392421 RepID=A0A1G6UXI4_9EURY|nr:hypothetical protein SAMN05192552_102418 [Natrinema hispanicum]
MNLTNVISIILQGIVVTAIGLVVYQSGHRWFKSINHEFDSKEWAQLVIVGFVFFTGAISDQLLTAIQGVVVGWTFYQQIGVVLIASRLTVNAIVPNWLFDDSKSLLVYCVGVGLFVLPSL